MRRRGHDWNSERVEVTLMSLGNNVKSGRDVGGIEASLGEHVFIEVLISRLRSGRAVHHV